MKRLRLERGLTQAALAERLDTTQQTIGRWESGITPPKIDTIVAIATALGVEVTELIDQEKLSQSDNQAKTGTNRTPENYWGHFAVRFPFDEKSTWYPIDKEIRDYLSSVLYDHREKSWIILETLNNKCSFINIKTIQHVSLLWDDYEPPYEDWTIPDDGFMGNYMEVYECLECVETGSDIGKLENRFTKNVIEDAKNIQSGLGLHDDDKLSEFLFDEQIQFVDGSHRKIRLSDHCIHDLLMKLDAFDGPESQLIRLEVEDGESVFIPNNRIAAITLPLRRFYSAIDRWSEDLERD